MNRSKVQAFTKLINSSDRIYLSAITANSFQEIVDIAYESLQTPIIVSDSMHSVLAVSKDIANAGLESINWQQLIAHDYVPQIRPVSDDDFKPMPRHMMDGEQIGSFMEIHENPRTDSGKHCTMSDLLDKGQVILKLAVTTDEDMTDPQRKMYLSLATALQLAYFRLGTRSNINNKGRYLLDLMQGTLVPSKELYHLDSFDDKGPFCLLCFDTSHLDSYNLSFISEFDSFLSAESVLHSVIDNVYVLLVNVKQDQSNIIGHLDQFARQRKFPIIISRTFERLLDAKNTYLELLEVVKLSRRFHNASGVNHKDCFAIFMMFESMRTSGSQKNLILPDAQTLIDHDKQKNSAFAQTVYCYLLHNCDAPSTANALFIHRNTLDKRIHKVEELFSPNWKDTQYGYLMLLSLYILLDEQNELIFYNVMEDII